jgi:hypothetical protein
VFDRLEEGPVGELGRREQIGGRGVRTDRATDLREDPHDVVLRASGAPVGQHGAQPIQVLRPARGGGQLAVSEDGALGRRRQPLPVLLSGSHQLHETIGALQHAADRIGGRRAVHHDPVVRGAAQPGAVQRQLRLLRRHVDPLRSAGPAVLAPGRHDGDGSVEAGVVVADIAADLDRRSVREAGPALTAREQVALAACVEHREVRADELGVRAGETERSDRAPHGRGAAPVSDRLEPRPAVLDHDVGRGDERRQFVQRRRVASRRLSAAQHDAALAGAEVQEPSARLERGAPGREGTEVTAGVAVGWFDLHDVGPEVGEQTGAEGAGRPAAALQHAHVLERSSRSSGIGGGAHQYGSAE